MFGRVVLAFLGFVAACSMQVGSGVHRAYVERLISDGVFEKIGFRPSRVSCPGINANAEFGKGPFNCTVVVEGLEVPYTVIQGDRVRWQTNAVYMPTKMLESQTGEMFAEHGKPMVVSCPAQPRLRIARADDEFECTAAVEGKVGRLFVHMTDADGNIRVRYAPPGAIMGSWKSGVWAIRDELVKALADGLRKKTGQQVSEVKCAGSGQLIEATGNNFPCTAQVDATEVIFDVTLAPETLTLSWNKR